jgi:3-oxoacyl-[acyl-carrier-protein] synthase I
VQSYLAQERLLCSDNSNGFVPGEGAGAILLTLAANEHGLLIAGVGCGVELSRPDGEIGNRALGLTQAIRKACAVAGVSPAQLQFRLSDQNGEQYFAKEGANAYSRVMADYKTFLPVLTIADCIGEVGAAAGVLMLAYLKGVMPQEDGPGKTGIMHLANDDGARSACLIKQTV